VRVDFQPLCELAACVVVSNIGLINEVNAGLGLYLDVRLFSDG